MTCDLVIVSEEYKERDRDSLESLSNDRMKDMGVVDRGSEERDELMLRVKSIGHL
jgi:hypothetical protein